MLGSQAAIDIDAYGSKTLDKLTTDRSGQRGTPNTVATEVVVYDQRRIV